MANRSHEHLLASILYQPLHYCLSVDNTSTSTTHPTLRPKALAVGATMWRMAKTHDQIKLNPFKPEKNLMAVVYLHNGALAFYAHPTGKQ